MSDFFKILVIDDDEVDRKTIIRSLKKSELNFEIETSETGQEGIKKIFSGRFDCIFIDFKLPDKDGLQLLREIRLKGVQTPVFIVTSHGDERIAAEAIKLGASDYIPKTLLSPEGISMSIRSAVRLHKLELARLQTENSLLKTQAQLETIVSTAPIALWSIDKQGKLTFAKGKGFELIGIKPTSIIGQSIFDLYQTYPSIIENINKALSGNPVKAIHQVDGFCFDSHYVPLFNEQSEVTGVTAVAFDITDRIKKELELKNAKELAEQSVKIKEHFLANMSHEIRTPMNGIIGLSKVLQKSPLNQDQQKYLKAIQTSADNLLDIINDLLDFSKIEAQKVIFEEIDFNILELLQETIDLLETKASENNNRLKIFTDARLPALITGDPGKLRQVLNNLIGNACKFTSGGSIILTAEQLSDTGDQVVIEFIIKDTGIGIAPEKLEVIFDSFTQATTDTTRKFGGTGLGLTISKKLVEMQGGAMSVKSEPGNGSAFSFTLSYRKADQFTVETASTELKQLDPNELGNLQVLLAEDNEINQLLVDKIITDWGYSLDIADNGKIALEMAENKEYDLILMDMQMPEMDGYEAIKHIRKKSTNLASVPIIALTAHAAKGEVEKCLRAGANAYVSKPFDPDNLLAEIFTLIHKNTSKTEDKLTANTFLDLSNLKEVAGGNEAFLLEILNMYMQQIPMDLSKLKELATNEDWESCCDQALVLHASMSQIGASAFQNILEQIQTSTQSSSTTKNIASLIILAEKESKLIVETLQAEISLLKT